MRRLLAAAVAYGVAAVGCASGSATEFSGGGAAVQPEPPTTGNKWVEEPTTSADGSRCFVLMDEECGGTEAADYLAYFEAPIFRTAHPRFHLLYAVDGSNVWALDASAPTELKRLGVSAGAGRALAITGQRETLYVAGGERGVIVLGINAQAPARLELRTELALPGPALDVALRGDGGGLYVAMGKAGVAAIDFGLDGLPETTTIIDVPGFATGVFASGLEVYVAGCSGLTVISAVTNLTLATLPIEPAPGEAPLPVKDVVVEGETAALAAGRWGMVFVDVADPAQMRVLGNRTLPDDLLYYGNGVTASHGQFYLAAGDWGVDRVSVQEARTGLVARTVPTEFPRYCTEAENPDRRPAPSMMTVLPPARFQDPLDVVVSESAGVLFAAGDASRLGLRAVDVYTLSESGAHTLGGRYQEPRRVLALAAGAGKVALNGAAAGVYAPTVEPALLQFESPLPPAQEDARVLAFGGDGRLVSLNPEGTLEVEGGVAWASLLAPTLAVAGTHVVGVREAGGVELFKLVDTGAEHVRSLESAPFSHGATHAFAGDVLYLSSPTWDRSWTLDLAHPDAEPQPLDAQSISPSELASPAAWRKGAPARVLIPFGQFIAEIASFGGQARGFLHPIGGGESRSFEVPPGRYVGGASAGDQRLVLVQGDPARYRTTLVELDFSNPQAPPSVRMQVFLGAAVGAATLDDVLYVGDVEAGVRAFRVAPSGVTHLGIAGLEASP